MAAQWTYINFTQPLCQTCWVMKTFRLKAKRPSSSRSMLLIDSEVSPAGSCVWKLGSHLIGRFLWPLGGGPSWQKWVTEAWALRIIGQPHFQSSVDVPIDPGVDKKPQVSHYSRQSFLSHFPTTVDWTLKLQKKIRSPQYLLLNQVTEVWKVNKMT